MDVDWNEATHAVKVARLDRSAAYWRAWAVLSAIAPRPDAGADGVPASAEQVSIAIGSTKSSTQRAYSQLRKDGILQSHGYGKGRIYFVIPMDAKHFALTAMMDLEIETRERGERRSRFLESVADETDK